MTAPSVSTEFRTNTVDLFQLDVEQLSARTEAAVLAVYAQMLSGEISTDTATMLIAGIVNLANASATATADSWLAVQIEAAARTPVPVIGVLPVDESDRLMQAVTTIFKEADLNANSHEGSVDTRLARLGRSEPLEAAHKGTDTAMKEQPLVQGWIRQTDADPCQLCQWWSRGGRVWPKDHPMPRHTGCNCRPRVVVEKSIKSTQFTRRRNAG